MRRVPVWWVAAVMVFAAGVVGLARGAVPQAAATGGATSGSAPIVVTGAYIRQPASPDLIAAYFTIYTTTAKTDTLVSAVSGAGALTELHSGPDMQAAPSGGVVIPAHGSVSFTPAGGHVMIQQLYSPVVAGQSVNIELDFANAGPVVVVAAVIGVYAAVPTGVAATATPSASTAKPVPTTATTGATR
jgi:copper(I)-binding protein